MMRWLAGVLRNSADADAEFDISASSLPAPATDGASDHDAPDPISRSGRDVSQKVSELSAAYEKTTRELTAEVVAVATLFEQMSIDHDELKGQLSFMRDRHRESQLRLHAISIENENLKSGNLRLQSSLTNSEANVLAVEAERKSVLEENQALNLKFDAISQLYDESLSEIQRHRSELIRIADNASELRRNNDEQKSRLEEAMMLETTYKSKVQFLEAELDLSRSQIASLQRFIRVRDIQLAAMRPQFGERSKASEERGRELDSANLEKVRLVEKTQQSEKKQTEDGFNYQTKIDALGRAEKVA